MSPAVWAGISSRSSGIPAYVEAAWGRLRRTRRGSDDGIAMTPTERDAPRIPFGNLVEQGVVPPGTRLFDRQRRVTAVVGADGTIAAGEIRGSIHKVGAAVQHARPATAGRSGMSSGTAGW